MKTRIGSILIMSFYWYGRHRTIKSIFIVANGICFVVKFSYQFFSSPIENSRPKFGSNFQPLKISKVPFLVRFAGKIFGSVVVREIAGTA